MNSVASTFLPLVWFALALFGSAALQLQGQPHSAAAPLATAPAPDLSTNPPPGVTAMHSNLPSIFIAGDSTAARGSGDAQMGWAVPFARYFDPAKVNVINRARGGRSSRTFITEGLWDALLSDVKRGDIVLIQFGHNDGGAINDASRARGSIRSLGEETQEIDNLQTKQHEVVRTFGSYMRQMIADVESRGATPVVLSLTARNIWRDGRIERGSGSYSGWASEIARAANVPFIDLTELIATQFQEMGSNAVAEMYPRDHTHFNSVGAEHHAAAVVSGLKGLSKRPVNRWLSDAGIAVRPDPSASHHFARPRNPRLPTLFLVGDSTVRNGRGDGAGGQWGWGDFIGQHFDADKVNVVNRALGGTSSRTFYNNLWPRVRTAIKPGDFVMMQFGHNDGGPLNDSSRARGTIRGTGSETETIDNEMTGKPEVVHTYGWYLRQFVAETRAQGATPIICSLVPRKAWRDGKIVRSKPGYAGWAATIASEEKVPFVDLHEIIATRYEQLGRETVDALFADQQTHTSAAGAETNAQCVVEGLRGLPHNPLATFLK
ncbi:MAG TPA: rhamnogalacturonan acetylesterase [Verrucomicrobiae bacterium]|nr:rhamnogalacturonan acetylesterase [Verrucomicrobiae bacterium]